MLLNSAEVNIKFMQMLQERSERRALRHLSEGIHVLGKAFAAVAVLAIRTRHVGVRVVDVARKEDTGVHLAPVSSHLLAVFAAGVEVGDLVGSEHVVHIFGEFGFQRGHHGELLADENLGEQLVGTGEHHGLLLEILDMRALGEELGHIVDLVPGRMVVRTNTGTSGNFLISSVIRRNSCVPSSSVGT